MDNKEKQLELAAKLGLVYPRELVPLQSIFVWWEISDQDWAMRNVSILPSFNSAPIRQSAQGC
jgi:hypothetical protein